MNRFISETDIKNTLFTINRTYNFQQTQNKILNKNKSNYNQINHLKSSKIKLLIKTDTIKLFNVNPIKELLESI